MKEQASRPFLVSDRPAEVWIKMLFAVTSIAVVLVGYIGNRVIEGQDEMTRAMSEMSGDLKAYGSRISRNERDIVELKEFHVNIRNGLKPEGDQNGH